MRTWQSEFPDFTDMPAIPENWDDISWHNDICPSFADATGNFLLFVDYADVNKREFQGEKRFAVYHCDESGLCDEPQARFASDDWNVMLVYLEMLDFRA